MPRKTELLTKSLDEARALNTIGDTATAANLLRIIEVDAHIAVLDRLTEIEKHLAALAFPFYEAAKDEHPTKLEQVPNTLGVKAKGS